MAQFDHRPNKVDYMDVVNGTAEVWIRANIKEHDDPKGKYWTAEEVCFRTVQNREEVDAQADALFFVHSNIQTELTAAVQEFMDKTVRTRGYDGIMSACSYVESTDEVFKAEGEACVAWRDACWRYCYDVLALVKTGQRDIPTAEELIAELPALEW